MASAFKSELKHSAPLLSAGIMSADLMQLAGAVAALESNAVKLMHFDVMDGGFCPLLTAGPFFVKGITTNLYKDVHLMVNDPLPLIPEFAKAGADIITVHVESGKHVHRALRMIGEQKNSNNPDRGILRGVALNPGTPLEAIVPLLGEADMICLLAVDPGFPGGFLDSAIDRFLKIKELCTTMADPPLTCIDGGITAETISKVAALHPDTIVSGSAIFKNNAISNNINVLTSVLQQGK